MNPLVFLWLIIIMVISIKNSKKKAQQAKGNPAPHKPMPVTPIRQEQQTVSIESESVIGEGYDPCHSDPAPETERLRPFGSPSSYTGSLGDVDTEGVDLCHPDHDDPLCAVSYEEPENADTEPVSGGLHMNWSGDEMLRAVIMQEVLKRPSERKASR